MRWGLCASCVPGVFGTDPWHCQAKWDQPGINGLLGSGFQCSCDCAVKSRAEKAK